MESNGIFIIIGFVVVITSIVIAHYFSKRKVILRKLKAFKSSALISAKHNQKIKVFGKAIIGTEVLKAPLSNRDCVYYHVKIIENENSKHKKTLFSEEKIINFMIEANGASALIKPNGDLKSMDSYIVTDKTYKSGILNYPTPNLEAFLKSKDIKPQGLLGFNKTLSYKEAIIAVNESIAVLATAKWKELQTPIEGYNYSKILQLEGHWKDKLVITDDPEGLKDKIQ